MFYTGQRTEIDTGDVSTPEEFKRSVSFRKKAKIRNKLMDNTDLISSFVKENPFDLSQGELEILWNWKENMVKGGFYVARYLKNYAVFLTSDEPLIAYGVHPLRTDFEKVIGSRLPIMVEAVLLPFKGKIVYDGFIRRQNIVLMGEIRKAIKSDYLEAKSKHGIITSLPFSPGEVEWSEAERLKFYLRNKYNRKHYREEIQRIIKETPGLKPLYHREMSKVHSMKRRRELKEKGVKGTWFAILDETVVASGSTKEAVESSLEDVLPEEKRDWVYIFQL